MNHSKSPVKVLGWKGDDKMSQVLKDPIGNFYIVGSTNSFGNGSYDGLVIKTDQDGNEIWHKCFGGADRDIFNTACFDQTGNIILAGSSFSFGASISPQNPYEPEIYMVKISPDGALLWQNTYHGSSGIYQDEAYHVICDRIDNSIVAAGLTQNHAYFLRVNENGLFLVDTTFSQYSSIWGLNKPRGLCQMKDGSYLFSVVDALSFDFPMQAKLIKINKLFLPVQSPVNTSWNMYTPISGMFNDGNDQITEWGVGVNSNIFFLDIYDGTLNKLVSFYRGISSDKLKYLNVVLLEDGYLISYSYLNYTKQVIHLIQLNRAGELIMESDFDSGSQNSNTAAYNSKNSGLILFGNLSHTREQNSNDIAITLLNKDGKPKH